MWRVRCGGSGVKRQVWRGFVSYLRLDSAVGIDDETLRGLWPMALAWACPLDTSDAADEKRGVDIGGSRLD